MEKKKIAVICTTFNRAVQLSRHIWSIAHQDYPLDKFVLIIVDDGSIDNTQEIIYQAFQDYPNLSLINILTDRKERGHFGGQGIAYNVGLRYAEELEVDYVFLAGGDILWPSYAITKHMEIHGDVQKRAWAVASQINTLGPSREYFCDGPPDPATVHHTFLEKGTTPDVLVGPRQYFIRPDRESLGNNPEVLAYIPDRYDWKPPEKLLAQPEALTLEDFGGGHIYIGLTGDRPCDIAHPSWPTLQSCKLEHWLTLGGWDEAGTGHFWEDEQLNFRLFKYTKWRHENNLCDFVPIVHPSVECFHQPHIRQLSHDNRAIFLENDEKYGFDVNRERGIDWGRSKHEIKGARIL